MKQYLLTPIVVLALLAAACGGSDSPAAVTGDPTTTVAAEEPVELVLVTHDSFFIPDDVWVAFEAETGNTVTVVASGDAGEVVSRAVLTAGQPEGDVMFGIDSTFLQRGLDAGVFEPHVSALLDTVDDELELDPTNNVTPISVSDVCVNYWLDAIPGDAPATLDDLRTPDNASALVVQNPETSSPGFAFLLATIARYGDGWEEYWQDLVDGGVTVSSGWSEAYYTEYAAGGGEKSMVVSYATSPPADVLFPDPPVDAAVSAVLDDSCFRQVEFAGILAGTDHPEAAAELIDFMLSPTYQAEIPLNMFVYPANSTVELPAEFVEYGSLVDDPITLDPAEIEANRLGWTARWAEIVFG